MLTEFMQVATALWPIFFTFALGFVMGKLLPAPLVRLAGYVVLPVVWAILWVIGVKSGAVLSSLSESMNTLKMALLYGGGTSVAAFVVLWPLGKRFAPPKAQRSERRWQDLWHPVRECVVAFALVLAGAYCHRFGWEATPLGAQLLDISHWLYALLILIGIELAHLRFQRAWVAPRILLIPALVLASSLATGAAISFFTGEKLTTALALSSGFGWFSLSGALADQYLGGSYGGIAVVTDLIRELLAIAAVFLLGQRSAVSSIGVGGATATSTTLPFVRQAYSYEFVPIAIISGLVLSLLAPLLMTFFMSLSAAV